MGFICRSSDPLTSFSAPLASRLKKALSPIVVGAGWRTSLPASSANASAGIRLDQDNRRGTTPPRFHGHDCIWRRTSKFSFRRENDLHSIYSCGSDNVLQGADICQKSARDSRCGPIEPSAIFRTDRVEPQSTRGHQIDSRFAYKESEMCSVQKPGICELPTSSKQQARADGVVSNVRNARNNASTYLQALMQCYDNRPGVL
jgi:hypothetical protein